jgi:hypothetical protein
LTRFTSRASGALAANAIRLTISFCAAACSGREGSEPATTLTVIDSAYAPSWDAIEDSGFVYRIEVSSPSGLDTVNDVIPPFPHAVGDTLVVGLLQAAEDSSTPQRKMFRLHLDDGGLDTRPLPPDVWAYFHDFVVSPDGRYAAYVAEDPLPGQTGTFATVRDLLTGEVALRGPAGGGCDCEVDTNYARWIAPDSFEIAVSHAITGAGWQRVSGRVSERRVHVDTLRKEPEWD